MKHKIVINAGDNTYEFSGDVKELTDDHIIIRTTKSEYFISRRESDRLVFIEQQLVEEIPVETKESKKQNEAARFVYKRLMRDPLADKLKENPMPPSQMPDQLDNDAEAMKNVLGGVYGKDHPAVKDLSLKQAIRENMSTEDDFSMNMGSEYITPLRTFIGPKNESSKKTRTD